jgi:hypothetical protein
MAKRTTTVVLGIIAIAIVAGVLLFESNGYSQLVSLVPESHAFTISVDYMGPWKVSYQGYSHIGLGALSDADTLGANVTLSGSGAYSKSVTLTAPHGTNMGLCVSAQKLDSSNATLILKVSSGGGGENETSLPNGSTFACGTFQP